MLIRVGAVRLRARLSDSPTADAVWQALPLSGAAQRWGDEVYFLVPMHVEQAPDAREEMAVGELGFWPVGDAVCIFFGPTPVSRAGEPRAYSPVNPFGRIESDPTVLRAVADGDPVVVEALD
jgi:hypothetical protein